MSIKSKISTTILIVFLVVFISTSLFIVFNTISMESKIYNATNEFESNAIKTEAIITNIKSSSYYDDNGNKKKTMNVYVKFEVDGIEYSGKLNTYSINMKKDQKTTIYYNPDNPSEFRGVTPAGLNFFKIVSLVTEVMSFTVIIILVIIVIRKKKETAY